MRRAASLIEPVSSSKANSSTLPGPKAIFSSDVIRNRRCNDSELAGLLVLIMLFRFSPAAFKTNTNPA